MKLDALRSFLIIIALMPVNTQKLQTAECHVKGDAWRFDCYPQGSVSKSECLARGCCWNLREESDYNLSLKSGLTVPICYFPLNYTTYTVVSVEENYHEVSIINATLKRPSPYNDDVKLLSTDIWSLTNSLVRIRVRDADNKRWRPPPHKVSLENTHTGKNAHKFPSLKVKWAKVGEPFGLTVLNDEGTILLQTAESLIFSNQFLQISFLLPSHTIYGLGQHRDRLMLNTSWSKYTLWNHDGHVLIENINLYGSHPFYLCKSGESWYGFLMYNSNAMDVILQPAPAITWRPIGGILDMYVFTGSSPVDVLVQYYWLIGRPNLPPYWSLGFQLCAQKYGSAQETLDVVERMRKLQIPQDVQWNDIEYGHKKRVFTNDEKTFGNQTLLADVFHKYGLHYVIMADCGIANKAPAGTYKPYDLGKKMDLFIKDIDGQDLVGHNLPGSTVWPDFLSPESQAYWSELVADFHQKVPFDGLWLDMNEICNNDDGSIHGCPDNSTLDHPPYLPNVFKGTLFAHTLCPSAKHKISSHYNVHNLYSLFEAKRSYNALKKVRKERPFLISRSSFPGLGHYGGTWSGDNKASWYDMYKSISAMLHLSMYGISMTGSDICGFYLNSTEELCTRWQQLGAFYSFARNHHSEDSKAQDPTAFSMASINSSRKVLLTRYTLLPYLYTLLWYSHSHGLPVIRPLLYEFPEDENTFNLDSQFLWGSSLLVSPVLKQGERHVWAYFPKAVWYDFYNGRQLNQSGQYIKLPAPLDVINLHIKGGSILVTQHPAQTTQESRKLPFGLIVALDSGGSATGYHYFDDGVSIPEDQNHRFNLLVYYAQKNTLHSDWINFSYLSEPMTLDNVTVFGLTFHPSQVTLNQKPVSFVYRGMVLYIPDFSFDLMSQRLHIEWKN